MTWRFRYANPHVLLSQTWSASMIGSYRLFILDWSTFSEGLYFGPLRLDQEFAYVSICL